jgi:dolichyl-phosphate-mannose-protein mannosyltransferase
LIVEGKFILADGIFHFFSALHIFCLCLFLCAQSDARAIAVSATLGAAVACKRSALGFAGLEAATQLFWFLFRRPPLARFAKRTFFLGFPAVAVYFGSWIWHFAANPFDGFNYELLDAKYAATVVPKSMENYTYWGERVRGAELLTRILYWNKLVNKASSELFMTHPQESSPVNWPFLMDQWISFSALDPEREIYCIGTPFVYWFSSAGIVLGLAGFLFGRSDWVNEEPLCGWALSLSPFIFSGQAGFLYNYLVPLMFAVMHLAAVIERWVPGGYKSGISLSVTLLCWMCFLYFAPWAYGTKCPDCKATRLWNERWMYGPAKELNLYGKEAFNTTEIYIDFPI